MGNAECPPEVEIYSPLHWRSEGRWAPRFHSPAFQDWRPLPRNILRSLPAGI